MNWFRNKSLDRRIAGLEERAKALEEEVRFLRSAATMRVGPVNAYFSMYSRDNRPVMTAIQAVRVLMEKAEIEPKANEAQMAFVDFVSTAKRHTP